MSVTTRTNRATNPAAASTTNWSAWAGTGGTTALTNQTSGGAYGTTFNRDTWSVATTAPSGGIIYTEPSGIAASTQYSAQMWVRSSKTQTVHLTADFRNSSNTVVNTVTGSNVALTANVWTLISVTGTSGALVTNVKLTASVSSGSNWASGDTFDGDAICIETGPTAGTYFDGSFTAAGSTVYAWAGTANASTSTATLYTPAIALVGHTDFTPCPRVEITLTDLAPSTSSVNIWRTADGDRSSVRSAEGISVVGSTFLTDYEVPFGRVVQYDLEVLTGVSAGAVAPSQTVTVTPAAGCIQDPLVPVTAVPLYTKRAGGQQLTLMGTGLKSLEYAAGVSLIPILGSSKPVALLGQVMAAANIPFNVLTNAAEQSTQLRNLLQETPLLLVRALPGWGDMLPGLVYTTQAKAVEQPFPRNGQNLTSWALTVNSVASPSLDVLVPIWTYGDVQGLWSTYQQPQTAFAAKTYLDALKSPTGV